MRVAARPLRQYPWYLRPFFWYQRRKYGRVLDAALLWARSPPLFLGLALFYGSVDRRSSPLSPALRSLVTVLVSQINHSAFCVDINSATLLKRGVPEEKIEALADWRHSSWFDATERAALAYAEAMTVTGLKVGDDLTMELRKRFDDDEIIELTALIAFQNLSSKFNSALGVPAQGFCRIPSARP